LIFIFIFRPQLAGNIAHLDGAGVTKANLLTRGRVFDQVRAVQAAAPGRFTWFNSSDVTQPGAERALTEAVKSGAQGFGEMKFHVAADGPELRRMYALAADLRAYADSSAKVLSATITLDMSPSD